MKIEISEVFITRTDAMTLDLDPAPVGITALEPRENPVNSNAKNRRLTLFDAFSRFLTAKVKKLWSHRFHPSATTNTISLPNTS